MLGNWVKETTTTTGTGNLTLAGAVTGFTAFDTQFGNSGSAPYYHFRYVIQDGNNWEAGIGHLTGSTTMVRDLIEATYSGTTYTRFGSALSLASGTKTVFCDLTSDSPEIPYCAGAATAGQGVSNMFSRNDNLGSIGLGQNTNSAWVFKVPISGIYSGTIYKVNAIGNASKFRVGMYAIGTDGKPGQRLATSADVTPATGITTTSFASNVFLRRGYYYWAFVNDAANSGVTLAGQSTQYGAVNDSCQITGVRSSDFTPITHYYRDIGAWSAQPDPFGTATEAVNNIFPYVSLLRTT